MRGVFNDAGSVKGEPVTETWMEKDEGRGCGIKWVRKGNTVLVSWKEGLLTCWVTKLDGISRIQKGEEKAERRPLAPSGETKRNTLFCGKGSLLRRQSRRSAYMGLTTKKGDPKPAPQKLPKSGGDADGDEGGPGKFKKERGTSQNFS